MVKRKIDQLLKDADTKELVLKSSVFFIIKVIGALSGYIFTLFIARVYGAEVNGLLAICFSIFLLGSLIPRLGFDINLVRTFSFETPERAKYIYLRTLGLSTIISVSFSIIGYIFRDFLAQTFHTETTTYIVYGVLSIPLWTIILINTGVLRGLREISKTSFFQNLGRYLFAIILTMILFYALGYRGSHIPGLSHTIGLGLLCVYSFFLVYKKIGTYSSEKNDFQLKKYVKNSTPMLFSASLILMLSWTDTIFMGLYNTTEEVGIYNVTLKITTLIGFSLLALDSILAPKIAKAHMEDDKSTFKSLIHTSVQVNFYFALVSSILLIAFREPILGMFGEEFLAGSGILIILCVGQFINAFCGPTGVVFEMTGHQKIFQNLVFVAFLVNLILDIILIKPYGYYGAAISSIAGITTWNILAVIYAWKKFKIRIFYYPFGK